MIQLIPLAGPLLALDRRVDVLGVRPDRRGARRRSRTSTRRASSRTIPPTTRPARTGARRRRCTGLRSRSSPKASRSSSGSSAAAAAWIFKVLAALGVLACTLLAARLARDKPYAAALVGWNPLFAIHFAGGGHNDSVLIALTLGALALAAAGRKQLAGRGLGARGPDQVGAARLLRASRRRRARRPPARRPRRLRGRGRRDHRARDHALRPRLGAVAFGPLARNAAEQSSYALPHRLEQLGVPHALDVRAHGGGARGGSPLARARGGTRPGHGSGSPGCLLLATTPWLTPWYAIWAVPLAAAEDDRRAQLISLALLRVPAAAGDPASSASGRRGCRPRRRRAASPGRASAPRAPDGRARAGGCRGSVSRVESTATQSASRSTGKLKIRRRSERCAPSAFVALTGAPSGTTARARRAAASCGPGVDVDAAERARARSAPASAASAATYAGPVADPGDAVDRRRQQGGDRRRRVVRLHGRLGDRAREQVQPELGQGRQQRERRREREQAERQEQRGEVARGRGRRATARRSGSRTPRRRPGRSAGRRRVSRRARPTPAATAIAAPVRGAR